MRATARAPRAAGAGRRRPIPPARPRIRCAAAAYKRRCAPPGRAPRPRPTACPKERATTPAHRPQGAGAPAVDVARKLIEQNDEAQAAARAVGPARKLAAQRRLDARAEFLAYERILRALRRCLARQTTSSCAPRAPRGWPASVPNQNSRTRRASSICGELAMAASALARSWQRRIRRASRAVAPTRARR